MNNRKEITANQSSLKKYSVNISAVCYGSVDVAARSEEEAAALAEKGEIRFVDWDLTDMEISGISEMESASESIRSESIPGGCRKEAVTEPLILEPEDWTDGEWKTLCKLAGRLPAERTQRMVLHVSELETFLSDRSAILAPASDEQKESGDDRTYIVTELCPHCMSEVEMRWDTDTMGFKAFCPVCGGRLMLCDECRHLSDARACGYDSKSDTCRYNPGGCSEHCRSSRSLRTETPLGNIVVKAACDPAHPGVYIDLCRPGADQEMPLALVEFSADDADNLNGEPHIATYVWGDAKKEDHTGRTVHQNIETYFRTEKVTEQDNPAAR